MNVVDILIVIFLIFGVLLGFKRGFTKELVKALGFIVVVVLSYLLKNPLSVILYEHLPFFNIGILKGVEVLNILVYEIVAFLICVVVFSIALKLLLLATTVFEKILNTTVILGIPSKILGGIIGLLHHFVIAFVVLYILSLTCFDVNVINESQLKDKIINNTPLLSDVIDGSINVINEFVSLKNKYEDNTISEYDFNYQAIDLFLKYDLVKPESIEKLIEKGKIKSFENYEELLNKYKGE